MPTVGFALLVKLEQVSEQIPRVIRPATPDVWRGLHSVCWAWRSEMRERYSTENAVIG